MTLYGVDHSTRLTSPAAFAQALKAAGKTFVCRYVAQGRSVSINATELQAMRAAGIAVVGVYEREANRALRGHDQGVTDAREAIRHIQSIGGPDDAPVYFAVDFDATPEQQDPINAYLRGVVSVLGKNRAGIYAGYWPLKRALDAGVVPYGWQTFAWSGGNWDPRAQLRQVKNEVLLGGIQVDLNEAYASNFGQWDYEQPDDGEDEVTLSDADVDRIVVATVDLILARLWAQVKQAELPDLPIRQGSVGQTIGALYQKTGNLQNRVHVDPDSLHVKVDKLAAAVAELKTTLEDGCCHRPAEHS